MILKLSFFMIMISCLATNLPNALINADSFISIAKLRWRAQYDAQTKAVSELFTINKSLS